VLVHHHCHIRITIWAVVTCCPAPEQDEPAVSAPKPRVKLAVEFGQRRPQGGIADPVPHLRL
jgi:hypothetical protein